MSSNPLFTIATITYNSGLWVRQAIESILASSSQDFELLISDDCSADNTWEIIKECNDGRIRSWQNEKNIGEYANRNKILGEARGRYIIYVDGDDIFLKHTLRNLSEYIAAFPDAGMIWGVNPQHFPFFVFPYEVAPSVNLSLIYRTHIPIANIGFGEVLFKTSALRSAGGFALSYRYGDTYIKKKLALSMPVLFVNIGLMFWRQSHNQASKRLSGNLDAFFERHAIDDEILADPLFKSVSADKDIIARNLRISRMKLLVSATLMKGKISSFFTGLKRLGLSLSDIGLVFKKGDYSYSPSSSLGEPLFNSFNFSSEPPL